MGMRCHRRLDGGKCNGEFMNFRRHTFAFALVSLIAFGATAASAQQNGYDSGWGYSAQPGWSGQYYGANGY
jgi:hypothetical protein